MHSVYGKRGFQKLPRAAGLRESWSCTGFGLTLVALIEAALQSYRKPSTPRSSGIRNQKRAWCILQTFPPNSLGHSKVETFERAFSHARWFTRGRTLQELIAPRNCNFYDSKWGPVGAKSALGPTLSAITVYPSICYPARLISSSTQLESA
jgi:hypothetical protein